MHLGKEEFITHIWCHTHAKPARANDEHWTAAVRSVLCYQFEIYAGNHVKFIVASFDIAFLFTSSRAIMTPLIHTQNIFSILFSRILHPVCFASQQRALNHRVKENRSGISFIFMKNFSFFSPALLLTPFESCFCCCSARDEKMRVKGGGGGIKATPKEKKTWKTLHHTNIKRHSSHQSVEKKGKTFRWNGLERARDETQDVEGARKTVLMMRKRKKSHFIFFPPRRTIFSVTFSPFLWIIHNRSFQFSVMAVR